MKFMQSKSPLLPKTRIWEIDALRGALILLVLCNHLNITVEEFCIDGYYQNFNSYAWVNVTDPIHIWFDWGADGIIYSSPVVKALRLHLTRPVVGVFFVVSGMSYKFSRNNLRNGVRLLCGAAFVSVFTAILVLYTGDKNQFIRFGVLHCYAACHLIHYFFLEERSDRFLLLTAVGSLIVGFYLQAQVIHTNFALLVPFGFYEHGAPVRDYWPVFPMLGWFLIGAVLGRRLYTEKKTRFPNQKSRNWHRPLCFLGRHSGLIYCGHMVVYTIVFCGVGHIFSLY